MKKTIKLVCIFMGVMLVVIVGGISGYLLISQNKTYYIYDLRIVEPVSNARSFVYTNSDIKYDSIKNKKVYMTSSEENRFEIGIYAYTSNNSTNIRLSSSDTSVAKIVYSSGKCFVEYLKEGYSKISVSIGNVVDSFDLYVYDQIAGEFNVFDNKYYGNYVSYYPNQIVSYSDDITYSYSYVASSSEGREDVDVINNSMLRIDDSRLNKDVFSDVYIDAVNKNLNVKCKSGLTKNISETIVIQSYYNDGDDIKVLKNYFVDVNIIAYTPEFLQILISRTPDFEDGAVFMDTMVIDESILTPELLNSDVEILDKFIAYQKGEENLRRLNELSVYETYFTKKSSTIYLKFRKVFTNGDIVYLTPNDSENPYEIVSDSSYLKLSANKTYYTLTLSDEYFESNETFDVSLKLKDYDLEHTFRFEYADLTEENLSLFYDYDEQLNTYTYKYWDSRTRFDNEIYDESGNIVDFYFD